MRKFYNNTSILGKISLIIIIIVVLITSFLPSRYPYDKPSGRDLEAPSKEHILGTDDLGIDIWAQMIRGGRISLGIGASIATITGLISIILGVICGYHGGRFDNIVMRIVDIILTIPQIPLMIVLGSFLGPSHRNIIIVLSLFSWANPTRTIRAKVLSIKNQTYVQAAHSYGANFIHMIIKHFLPEITPLLFVSMIRTMSRSIVTESSLSFLGLGDVTSKSWGMILNYGINFQGIYFTNFWKWWIVPPLLIIVIIILGLSFIGKDAENMYIKEQ